MKKIAVNEFGTYFQGAPFAAPVSVCAATSPVDDRRACVYFGPHSDGPTAAPHKTSRQVRQTL